MSMSSSRYRQEVAQFRRRLDTLLARPAPDKGRLKIDDKGGRTRAQPFKNLEQRVVGYGARRFESVARLLAVMQIAREAEGLHRRNRRIEAEATGAVWQAFTGTDDSNACHTCPTHLQLNGQLPTQITRNRGLQRHLIIEFADCVLMPRAVNEVDIVIDESFGRVAFKHAVERVLNERGMDWREGAEAFREEARDLMGPMYQVLFDPSTKHFVADDTGQQALIDTVAGYYEGMFLTPLNVHEVQILGNQVQAEMGQAQPPTSESS